MEEHARMPHPRPADGFTLVEALVALGLFAVGMAALMPLALSNVRANSNASVRTEAVALAQEKIEEFRATTFSDLPAVGANDTEVLDSVFTRRWDVAAVPSPPAHLRGDDDDLRRVRVEVSWSLPDTSGSVTLTTSKTRY